MDTPSLLQSLLTALGVVVLLTTLAATLLLWWLHRKLQLLRIATDASLGETLRSIPFLLALALDLLDMGLNLFAAPFVWFFLHRMGWMKLRNLATAAAAIPGTQFVPILSIAWIAARIFGPRTDRLLDAAEKKGAADLHKPAKDGVTTAGIVLALVALAACSSDDEPDIDITTLPVRACDAPLDPDPENCDGIREGTYRPTSACLDVDFDAVARGLCEDVRFPSARHGLSGEVSVDRFSWNVNLRWNLDATALFPETCFLDTDLDCQEIRRVLERDVHRRVTCIGFDTCRCSINMSGHHRDNGTILLHEENFLILNDGSRFDTCGDDPDLHLRPLRREARDPDIAFSLVPQR